MLPEEWFTQQSVMAGLAGLQVGQGQGRQEKEGSEQMVRSRDRTRARMACSEGSARNEDRARTRTVCSEGSTCNKDRTRTRGL